MNRRTITLSVSVAALLGQALGLAGAARAASPIEVPFGYTGGEQSWVVPSGVTSIHVTLLGGHGGTGQSTAVGGSGQKVSGDLAVLSGQTLYVEVAGIGGPGGGSNGGFNGGGSGGFGGSSTGGGGGGGASDIRTIDRLSVGTLDSRLIVAAGGGGGGGGTSGGQGGAAGTAGQGGTNAQPGQPGSQVAGGSGGTGINGSSGQNGSAGQGGAGESATSDSGGGGGAGYFGGGGGGGSSTIISPGGAGGGGGSSYIGAATNTQVVLDPGLPYITIDYTPADAPSPSPSPDNGTVGAQVTVPSSAACLEISTAAVDFGTLPLGSEDQAGTPDITVTNCAGVSSDIYAHATDASDGAAAAWTLQDSAATCADSLGLDTYRLGLEQAGVETGLSTTNKLLESLGSGAAGTHTARIFTACPGSTGSGSVMSMQVVFLATTGG